MKSLLGVLVLLSCLESIRSASTPKPNPTASPELIEKCVLFKYSANADKVRNASGIYADYTQYVTEELNDKNETFNVFYQFIEIFEKTKGLTTCKRTQAHCMMKRVPRVTPMNSICYNTRGAVQKIKNSAQLDEPVNLFPYKDFFGEYKRGPQTLCDDVKKIKTVDNECEQTSASYFNYNLDKVLIKEINIWNYFALNTCLIALGLFTNTVCLAVFIHSKYLLPRMGNRTQFILYACSNIVQLITMWFLNTLPPGYHSDMFVRNNSILFSALVCKILFYVNLASFFLSELIIVTISFHRALAVFFPMKIVVLNAKFPLFFEVLFGVFASVALLLPFINLIFNKNVDMAHAMNIAEKFNLSEYCYVDSLAGNISSAAKLVLAFFMIITLTISSAAIIIKLIILKKKRKNLHKKMPKGRNFFSAVFSKGTSNTTDESENVKITESDNKSSYVESKTESAAQKVEKTAKDAARSKNDAINNMIIVLAIATIFFNIVYLVIFFNMSNISEWVKEKNYTRIVINREVETILILVKFSITGLLFFVSGEVFRANLYAFSKKIFFCKK